MTHKKFVKDVGKGGPVSDVLSKLKRGTGSSDPGSASCEGWLLKQASMNGEWKRRWVVLSAAERKLVYYKSDTAKKPQGYVALDNATVEEKPSASGTPSICITTSAAFDQDKQASTYWFQGQGEGQGEIFQWIDAMEQVAMQSLPFHVARQSQVGE